MNTNKEAKTVTTLSATVDMKTLETTEFNVVEKEMSAAELIEFLKLKNQETI